MAGRGQDRIDGEIQKPDIVGSCPGVEVEVAGVKVPCILDTGSQVTLFSESFVQKWLGHVKPKGAEDLNWLTLKAANGLSIPYVGYAILDFAVAGVKVPGKGVVIVKDECLGGDKGVLGMNVIIDCWKGLFKEGHPGPASFKVTVTSAAKREWERAFVVCNRISQDETGDGRIGVARLNRQCPVEIPPASEMVLWAQLREGQHPTVSCVLVEGTGEESEWQVARTLSHIKRGKVPLRIKNVNPYPVTIPQRYPLAYVFQVCPQQVHGERELAVRFTDPRTVEVNVHNVKAPPTANHPLSDIQWGEVLSKDQQAKADQLLHRWSAVFAAHEEDFGRTDAVLHTIPTGEAAPSRERYRPIPPTLYAELRGLLQSMLETGVIRESASPWAAPIVLVRKKDGAWRFCVDYRRLNALTHKDSFPLPRIEESLTCLRQSSWYSTLDLASGYWQVEVDARDREKTAFTTPLGLYEFNRMPFGLCNAPATFQRLMQRCLGGMINESLLIYLDDVLLFSPDFDSHLQHLEAAFEKLWQYGLKLQPHKCKFFQRKVNFLGHVVSKEGVATDPEKTAAVQQWPPPTTVKEVRSFLGFVGYYRRFIPSFSKIAAPLHSLLVGTAALGKRDQPVQWTPECDVVFRTLKDSLLSAPILAFADFSKPFNLYTDASFEGLGAVLAQVQEGRERVIAYASRSLHPSERNDKNYSSFKLELLGLKWAVTEKFKDYLWGATFTVFTDNSPLVHLDSARLGATEQRWVAQLANFQFTLKYRPGVANRNADALSRLGPVPQSQANILRVGEEDHRVPEDPEDWLAQQRADPALQEICRWLRQGKQPDRTSRQAAPEMARRLLLDWDRLYLDATGLQRKVRDPGTGQTRAQLVVPKALTRRLWERYHVALGHLGVERTEAALRQGYFWPRMGRDLRDWTAECPTCICSKAGPEVRAPMHSIATSYPLEIVAIDFLSLGRPADTYQYLLVVTDLFSRYGWAFPTKDQTAETTARVLWRGLIQTWGCPEKILSDRGAAFESSLLDHLLQLYGGKKLRTTPYHPQGNGSCERFNKTLLSLLGSLEEQDKARWPDHLPALLMAYNTTVHSSTGMTPYFIMYGRHARLPVDIATGLAPQQLKYDLNDWVHAHHQILTNAFHQAQSHSQRQQERDKQRYDRRSRTVPLLPGERVLVRNFRRRSQGKLAPHWQRTPFVVIAQVQPGHPVYKVRPEGGSGPEKTIHRNNLRPCTWEPETANTAGTPIVRLPEPSPSYQRAQPMFLPVHIPVAEPPSERPAERLSPAQVPEPLGANQPEQSTSVVTPQSEAQNPLRRSQRESKGILPTRYRE